MFTRARKHNRRWDSHFCAAFGRATSTRRKALLGLPSWRQRIALLLFFLAAVAFLGAQEPRPLPIGVFDQEDPQRGQFRLAALLDRSAIIFAGQVMNVDRSSNHAWMSVRFNVTTGVKGVPPDIFEAKFIEAMPGTIPLFAEENLAAFLHASNAAGLTSFVANNCGLYQRAGADRVSLRRLQLWPAAPSLSFASLPEPVAFWPDPSKFFPEQFPSVLSSPVEEDPLRLYVPAISTPVVDTMDTSSFLGLLFVLANSKRPAANPRAGGETGAAGNAQPVLFTKPARGSLGAQ